MGITLVIVGGITVITLITVVFDFLGKRAKKGNPQLEKRVAALEAKQNLLENSLMEKDEKIERLSEELSFLNRLLDERKGN